MTERNPYGRMPCGREGNRGNKGNEEILLYPYTKMLKIDILQNKVLPVFVSFFKCGIYNFI